MTKEQKRIFIIDGSSFLYRAYYAIRPLHTKNGMAVNAVYGFCRMIKKLLDAFDPRYMVVVWDCGGKTTRHTMYPAYKEKRQCPPTDLIVQKELIREFIKTISLPMLEQYGVEADDLMHVLTQKAVAKEFDVVVVSTDKDMGQLVNDKVILYDAFKQEFLDTATLTQKYGFPPSKIAFYFSLLGDTSDNIPGVKGVGEKTATELVKQFESLEDLYKNIEKVSSETLRNKLLTNKDNAFLSHQLFLLQDIPVQEDPNTYTFNKEQWPQARDFFTSLEFKTLVKELPSSATLAKECIQNYATITITTEEQLVALCNEIKNKKVFAFDAETHGVRPLQDDPVGFCICVEEGISYYIPFGHETGERQLPKEYVLKTLKPLFEDATIKKYMHHAKFDMLVLYSQGIYVKGLAFDTIIAASIVRRNNEKINLKTLSELYLNEPMPTYSDVVTAKGYKSFAKVPLSQATIYGAADAHQTLRLVPILQEALKRDNLETLYYTIELPLVEVLLAMEANGIYANNATLTLLGEHLNNDLTHLHRRIIELLGPDFNTVNLNSPKQVEQILFEHLQLPRGKKTTGKTGYSTDQEVLQELSAHHEVPKLISKYRELFKLKSTYIESLPTYINPKTGNIHTNYNQTVVTTGRLSSSDPNLQNIPVTSEIGISLRTAFQANKDTLYLSADYSQIELRVLAHLSGDNALKAAFLEKIDIHAQTASYLFDVPLDQVAHEQRQTGKRINFSILYGLTPYSLAKDLKIPFKEAEQFIARYFEKYNGVAEWIQKTIEKTKECGYTETLWGRKRYVPGIYERNKNSYDAAVRIAVNTPVQGTQAELIKLGMIQLYTALQQKSPATKMLLQIHDELLLQVPEEQIIHVTEITHNILQNVVQWDIPLVVTTRAGKNWQEATK